MPLNLSGFFPSDAVTLGHGHQFKIIEVEEIGDAGVVVGEIIPEAGRDIIGGGGAGPEEAGRFLHGFTTGLEAIERGGTAKIENIRRLGDGGDDFTDALITVEDNLVIGVAAGVLLEF